MLTSLRANALAKRSSAVFLHNWRPPMSLIVTLTSRSLCATDCSKHSSHRLLFPLRLSCECYTTYCTSWSYTGRQTCYTHHLSHHVVDGSAALHRDYPLRPTQIVHTALHELLFS